MSIITFFYKFDYQQLICNYTHFFQYDIKYAKFTTLHYDLKNVEVDYYIIYNVSFKKYFLLSTNVVVKKATVYLTTLICKTLKNTINMTYIFKKYQNHFLNFKSTATIL